MTDPFARFAEIFARATSNAPYDATAMALATADAAGRPSVRMVLLKGHDERGFVFYTNRESRKGQQLEANPVAALCIYWPHIEEQVRVEGAVVRVTEAESDAYFASRHPESQLGAWASQQSRPLESRAELLRRVADVEARYAGGVIPRPPHWGGYRIVPARIEFWKAGEFRLHDREIYLREGAGFRVERQFP